MEVVLPLDLGCAKCGAAGVMLELELPAQLEAGSLPVPATAKCGSCDNSVIFGSVVARVSGG